MQKYCQLCGSPLTAVGDHLKYWIIFYECSKRCMLWATYLEVSDPNWSYPLQILEFGTLERALSVPEGVIGLAVSRIKRIDYKTISILYFEQTIWGSYGEGKEYKVVYPDGSTT